VRGTFDKTDVPEKKILIQREAEIPSAEIPILRGETFLGTQERRQGNRGSVRDLYF